MGYRGQTPKDMENLLCWTLKDFENIVSNKMNWPKSFQWKDIKLPLLESFKIPFPATFLYDCRPPFLLSGASGGAAVQLGADNWKQGKLWFLL